MKEQTARTEHPFERFRTVFCLPVWYMVSWCKNLGLNAFSSEPANTTLSMQQAQIVGKHTDGRHCACLHAAGMLYLCLCMLNSLVLPPAQLLLRHNLAGMQYAGAASACSAFLHAF